MRIVKSLLVLCALLLSTFGASAQCSGNFNAGEVCGNETAADRTAHRATLTSMFDRAFCSTNDRVLNRVGGQWACASTLPNAVQDNITRLGTITQGVWNGTDIAFANIAQCAALSLAGVAGNSTADLACIAASVDGQIMRRSGTSIAFGSALATFVNTTAPGTGGATVTQQAHNQRTLWAADYGAVCDGTTDDATAFQNLINAATANKAPARFTGFCKVNTSLTWTSALDFGGVSKTDSRIISANGINTFVSASREPFVLSNFMIKSTSGGATGVAVTCNGVSTLAADANVNSLIDNVRIETMGIGLLTQNCANINVRSSYFNANNTNNIRLDHPANCDAGDHEFVGNTFIMATASGNSVLFVCVGGTKWTGNKWNSVDTVFAVRFTLGAGLQNSNSTSHVFTGNSIEGSDYCFLFQRSAGTGLLANINISGNELTCRIGVSAQASGGSAWIYVLGISSNTWYAISAANNIFALIDGVLSLTGTGNSVFTGVANTIEASLGSQATGTWGANGQGIVSPGTFVANVLNNVLSIVTSPTNAQTGASYAISNSDRGKLISASNAGAQAYTIAQAGVSNLFQAGWFTTVANISTNAAGIVTITATTSTFSGEGLSGSATLRLGPGQSARITSDGTNYLVTHLTGPGAVFQASSGLNPTGTTSATYVMQGNGSTCTLTPLNRSRVRVQFVGYFGNNTATGIPSHRIAYGTGAAPANGVALTGTVLGSNQLGLTGVANSAVAWSAGGIATGLTPGTAYWFDMQQQTLVGGTSVWNNVTCNLSEE